MNKVKCGHCEKTGGSFRYLSDEEKYYCYQCIRSHSLLTCPICKCKHPNLKFNNTGDLCHCCSMEEENRINNEYAYIKENIIEVFTEFRNTHRRYMLIEDNHFQLLKEYLDGNLSPVTWAEAFLGLGINDILPVKYRHSVIIINNNQGRELISILKDKVENMDQYKYVHAFGCHTLIPQELISDHHIMRYYGCRTKETLFDVWENIYYWLYNCGNVSISQCFCQGDIISGSQFCECKYCGNLTHISCKHTMLKYKVQHNELPKCEYCNSIYKESCDIKYYGSKRYISSKKNTMRYLTWIDYTYGEYEI
ncbi:Hypothetical protein ORPV_957 [Orpheovirus IHUMI-LCC2]|uniref:Uncharacterized protein n=1 Tax=Orpheovirus IHUMI-LCC2 TaxID=2023057 RepID=A0A2I2L5S0_9VIRU|nr:Hypothetical protein ORPV_957 [Orpheovirus IHUMI-LCC2]SNW62861.1 Hypothetical protein ORPV_957 [Orpheovirus IHUMI-LCC2]